MSKSFPCRDNGGPLGPSLLAICLGSLAQRGRQVAAASAGTSHVTVNPVDFYHKAACLTGVETPQRSFGESANMLTVLLPGFQDDVWALPVPVVSLDDALNA
jgi:hypothetical protein